MSTTACHISSRPGILEPGVVNLPAGSVVKRSQTSEYHKLDDVVVGEHPSIVELKRHVLALGKSDQTVLISGESGTGKELVARAIHEFSPRANNPFIKINSAAVPTSLFESELFGFEKGAFTGAWRKKPGKFQLAHSGTILLDEICEIPLSVQGKLLQVLEDNKCSPLGSNTNTRIDARVLVATNANLSEMVSQGQFRLDLYYRINAVTLQIPPLRDRRQDIDLLCDHFLSKYAARAGKAYLPLTDRIREQFLKYCWPGNVRELQNVIQAIAVLGNEESFCEKITRDRHMEVCINGKEATAMARPAFETPCRLRTRYTLKELSRQVARKAETNVIVDVLSCTGWNRKRAAALLKTSYRTLLSKIKEYGIEKSQDIMTRQRMT